jgi:hypothetical protein
MAKNATKAKTTAKKAKTAKSTYLASRAGADEVRPRFLRRGKAFKMGAHDVVRAVKMLEAHGQLDKFVRASKRANLTVLVGADTVNFVKRFVVANEMHADPVGRHIVNAMVAPGDDPYAPCKFRRRG